VRCGFVAHEPIGGLDGNDVEYSTQGTCQVARRFGLSQNRADSCRDEAEECAATR
jgi:hypothetical protein